MATLSPEDRALLAAVADRPVNLLTQDRVLAASVQRVDTAERRAGPRQGPDPVSGVLALEGLWLTQ